jgi:drug/metabolite transporter (DMT)-like permease
MLSAVFSAVCYGVASTMQAAAARAERDDRHGIDPRLFFRLLRRWRYLAGLGLDVVGLAAQIGALRSLPLFLVQATQSAAIPVTAVLSTIWFGTRLRHVEWIAVFVVCGGLSLLGLSAQSEGAGHASLGFHAGLLVFGALLVFLGLAAGRMRNSARSAMLGLISGFGFGAIGIAIRVLPDLSIPTLVRDPATYTVLVAGFVGGWFYAAALQRGGVVAATAMMLIGETVPPALIGVLLLGDHARPGWTPVAVAGFVIAIGGALALARFGEVGDVPDPAETDTRTGGESAVSVSGD